MLLPAVGPLRFGSKAGCETRRRRHVRDGVDQLSTSAVVPCVGVRKRLEAGRRRSSEEVLRGFRRKDKRPVETNPRRVSQLRDEASQWGITFRQRDDF